MGHRSPSPGRFVVRIPRDQERLRRLGDDDVIESIDLVKGSDLVEIRTSVSEQAEESWRYLQDRLGEDAPVYHVLKDDRGAISYPSGRVTVRFSEPPSPQRLDQLAETLDLELAGQNRYQPLQYTLAPREPAKSYLPEIVKSLQKDEDITAAWEEALASHKRSSR